MTKPKATDWRARALPDWSVATFRQYLADKHVELYGIPYVTNSYAIDGRHLKSMIAEHGAEVVKAFIDVCFAEYKPTRNYPGLNFIFMFSYMRARILPRILAEVARKQAQESAKAEQSKPAETGVKVEKEWW